MATFFGEILPVHSRAIDEDDEDVAQCAEREIKIVWKNEQPKSTTASKISVVFAFGHGAVGFIAAYLLNEDDIESEAVITLGGEECCSFSAKTFSEKRCHIIKMQQSSNTIFVLSSSLIRPEEYFSWVEQVFSEINKVSATNEIHVSVLCSSDVSEYKCHKANSELDVPFLRMLKTDCCNVASPCCPFLETPNVVLGLPSQVLSYCQVYSTPAQLFICYVETIRTIDSSCMKQFRQILPCFKVVNSLKVNEKGDAVVLDLARQLDNYTTIYI